MIQLSSLDKDHIFGLGWAGRDHFRVASLRGRSDQGIDTPLSEAIG